MEQLDESDGNGHRSKTNNNYFAPLFESDDEEITRHRIKIKTPIMVLNEDEEGRKKKGYQNKGNEEDKDNRENKIMAKMYDPDSDDELNGDFLMAEFDYNSDNDKKEHTPRAK